MNNRELISDSKQVVEIIVGILTIVSILWPQVLPSFTGTHIGFSFPTPTLHQKEYFARYIIISFFLAGVVGGITQGKAFTELNPLHLFFSFFFRQSVVGALWGAIIANLLLLVTPYQLIGFLYTFDWQRVLALGLLVGVFSVRWASPKTTRQAVLPFLLGGTIGLTIGAIAERLSM